jgi:PncC family amidohydrolase
MIDDLMIHAERVAVQLKARKETLAIAESAAGGLITAALLAVPGASAYCRGGLVIYTRDVLLALKAVNVEELSGIQASTEAYARFEAKTVRAHLDADWGLGETGAAGPTGNRYGNAAGHACVAVCGGGIGGGEWSRTIETGSSDRQANMKAFARAALELMAETLELTTTAEGH